MDATGSPDAPAHILEQDVRLSSSFLWSLQHAYYQASGAGAWRGSVIPEYVSTSPYLARAYARVVYGFLRDCASLPASDQPVYILELGAGSGRFAFHFLRFLSALTTAAPNGLPPFRYVMSDFAASNLAAWQSHPAFQKWIAAGRLDFALFDAANDSSLTLERQGVTLSPGSLDRPLVVIANYLFDSLPQDAFALSDGVLHESLLTITSNQLEPDASDPTLMRRIDTTFRDVPTRLPYYPDTHANRILDGYTKNLADGHFTFPITALRCLQRLAAIPNGRMLLLAGDKGYTLPADIVLREHPRLVVYGAFSMTVNLHAIGQSALDQGGRFLRLERDSTLFNVCAALYGAHPLDWPETALAYQENVAANGPDDFYTLQQIIERSADSFNIQHSLACLRLSAWDPWMLIRCAHAIRSSIQSASPRLVEDLARDLDEVWANFFAPVGEEDVAFDIASILEAAGRPSPALEYYRRSLVLAGPHPAAYTAIARCFLALDRRADALENVYQALGLVSNWQPARQLLAKLEAQTNRGAA